MPAQFPLRDFLLRLDAEGIRVRVRGLSPHRFGLTGERTLDAALIAQHPSGTAGEERTPAEPPVSLVRLLLLPISCDGRSDRRRDRHPSLSERPAGSGICAGQPTGTSPSIASPSTADQQTFPLTDRLTLTTTNGRTIERWKKSIPRYVRSYVKKSRNPDPTAAIVDSQSIKGTPESCLESGFDGGKPIKGRKRNILFDTMGCLIIVRVFAGNVFDGKAARQLITDLFSFLHTITKIWADSGYSGPELSDWLWHPIRMPDRGR